jgi:hypothetical protein
VDRLLLAWGRSGLPVGAQFGWGEWLGVPAVSIQRQKECGPFLHDPHSGVGMPVDASLMPLGFSEEAFQIQIVLREVQQIPPDKQTQCETLHHSSDVLAKEILASHEPELYLVEFCPALFRGTVFRIEGRLDRANVLDLSANLLLVFGDRGKPPVNAPGEPIELIVCGPPFSMSRLRWSDWRTSPRASAILTLGGDRGPP